MLHWFHREVVNYSSSLYGTTLKAWAAQNNLHLKNTSKFQSFLTMRLTASPPEWLSWQQRHCWPELSLTSTPEPLCMHCTMHAVNAQSVTLIITGKNVSRILTRCTFLSPFRLRLGHAGCAARIHKLTDAAAFIDVLLSGMLHKGGSIWPYLGRLLLWNLITDIRLQSHHSLSANIHRGSLLA